MTSPGVGAEPSGGYGPGRRSHDEGTSGRILSRPFLCSAQSGSLLAVLVSLDTFPDWDPVALQI